MYSGFSVSVIRSKPRSTSAALISSIRTAPATQPTSLDVRLHGIGRSAGGRGRKPPRPPGFSTRVPPHARFVGRQVQHAVGNDHIHARVSDREVLDLAEAELDVVEPGALAVHRAVFLRGESMSGVMSMPMTRPLAPTFGPAMKQSNPPPDPGRSRPHRAEGGNGGRVAAGQAEVGFLDRAGEFVRA